MTILSRDRRSAGRIAALAVTLTVCSLLALSCFKIPDSPVGPRWETQLSVPLVDTVYYLKDALQDNPNMIASETSYVYHPINLHFDSLSVGDHLRLAPSNPPKDAQDSLGSFSVSTPGPLAFEIPPLSVIGPHADGTPIDPFSNPLTQQAPPISQFEYAHCVSGNLQVSVHNSLPVTVNFPNGVVVRNTSTNDVVASFPPASIAPHTSWIPSPASLAGKIVRTLLRFETTTTSPGSGGVNETVPADSGLQIVAALTDAIADEVQAHTFQRTLIDTSGQQWPLDDSTYIRAVTFNRGSFAVHLENQTGVDLRVNFLLNEFRNAQSDDPFIIASILAAHAPYDTVISLHDWAIKGTGPLINKATFGLSIATDTLSSPSLVTVRSSDFVLGRITVVDTPFVIHSLAGVLRPLPFAVDQTNDIPLGNITTLFSADSVALQSILMALEFFTAAGHPLDFSVIVNGLDDGDRTVASMVIPPRRIFPGIFQTITLSDTIGLSRFLSEFLTHRPAKIRLTGWGILNPPENYDLEIHDPIGHPSGVITDTTNFYYFLNIDAPLRVAIFNGAFTDTVSFGDTVTSGGKIDKNILTSVKQATMYFIVENAMGLGVSLQTRFQDSSSATILTVPRNGVDSIVVAAGTPEVPYRTPAPIAVRLQPNDADKFENTQRIIVRLGVNSGGTMVKFRPGNYVRVRAYANLVYLVDPNK